MSMEINNGDGSTNRVESVDERNESANGGGIGQANQAKINAEKFKPASKFTSKRVTEEDMKRAAEVRGYLRDSGMICIEFKAPTRVALGHLNEEFRKALAFTTYQRC